MHTAPNTYCLDHKLDSDSYYRGLLRGDIWLAMSYSIDIYKTMQDIKISKSPIKTDSIKIAPIEIEAMLQKEGNVYELDNMVIPLSTLDTRLSYEFINNALDSKSAFELSSKTGSSIPNFAALKQLDPNITKIDWVYPKDMKKMYILTAYDPKTRILVNSMWSEIQMQCRQI